MIASDGRQVNPETEFFTDENGNIRYYAKCDKCEKECKQSFRLLGLACEHYIAEKINSVLC